ncbi:transposase [Chitinispirillales bacterium ANBcel5]|uniref:transposase n=1 Tax=Cellulosispirillum alkaliphilum TaxID=3039283 RepID=UPI002A582354|nr:transposase [Chitinispirillales bacterium ANBcel5]
MPTTRRIEVPGALAHIMAHSIEQRDLFVDDSDRNDFLQRLKEGLRKTGYKCYAWTLMDNHYHLLVRTNYLPMSKLMRALNGGYAQYYNKRHKRRGYLFQNRFKSVICQDQGYASQLIKYIHLNPLRAGKVRSLEQLESYSWCGHGFLIGKPGSIGESFQDRDECLVRFGKNRLEGVNNYRSYCDDNFCFDDLKCAGKLPETNNLEIKISCKGWPAVIGDSKYVKETLEKYKKNLNRKHRVSDYPYVLKTTMKSVCNTHKIEPYALFRRGRINMVTQARASFCYLVHELELIPCSVISEYLKISIGSVSRLAKQGRKRYHKELNQIPSPNINH